jgi:hypothetical protein
LSGKHTPELVRNTHPDRPRVDAAWGYPPGGGETTGKLGEKKGRAPLEALPFTAASSADCISVAYVVEALPFTMPSDPAVGTGDASVDEVSECNNRQCRSYHRAPSFQLASYIDSRITSQMGIFIFALEIGFTGINVSFISVVGVVLSFIFGHHITSLFLWLVFRLA